MKKWTIAKRITTGGATLVALLLVISGVSVGALTKLEQFAGARLRDDAIPGMVNISELTTLTLRGYIRLLMAEIATDPAARDNHLAKSDENIADATTAIDLYEKAITAEIDRKNFTEMKQKRAAFREARATFISLLKANKKEEAMKFELETMEPAYFAFREQMTMMGKWNADVGISASNEMIAVSHEAKIITAVVAGGSLLIALILGVLIIRSTNRALQTMAVQLDDASSQVAAASLQVSSGSQSLAEGSSEQASSLEESSSSLEELASMTSRNAESASSAKALSAEARAAADTGNGDMAEMRNAMEAIKTSSNDIANIIKSIDEIAFQTNILALNAAVEAARAGAAGAGFAVVADEVRALAQRSANSAKETASKIEVAIQNSEHGVQISSKVANSLGTILEKVRKVDELVAEIATASSEQSQGIGQINTAVGQMDKITQANAANAEETAAASEELTAQSASLKETVVQLRQLVGGGSSPQPARAREAVAKPVATTRTASPRNPAPFKPAPRARQAQPVATTTATQGDSFFKNL